MSITIYGIKNCETMNKARAWLDKHGVDYAFHDYKTAGKRIRLVLLLTYYFENLVYSVGRRQAGQIDNPQFGFLRRPLANVRQNFAIAAGPSKGSHWFAINGTRPRDEVADAVATKELDVVKSLHQAGKQHVKSFADIVVSFVCAVRQ